MHTLPFVISACLLYGRKTSSGIHYNQHRIQNWLLGDCHVVGICLVCGWYVVALSLICFCYVVTMWLLLVCYMVAKGLLCG